MAPICPHIAQEDWEGYCLNCGIDDELPISELKIKRPLQPQKRSKVTQPKIQHKEVVRKVTVCVERTFRPGMTTPSPSLPERFEIW